MNKTLIACTAAVALLLAACSKQADPPGMVASSASAPISVSTVPAVKRDFPVRLEATGTVTALNSVDVKPQVASMIAKVHFREGQFVKAGQLLFTLDARTDETNVLKAQAQLRKDEASLADVQRQLARSRELLAQNFVSQTAVDTNQAQVDAQRAGIEADRAALKAAQVGLSYSRIVAPGSGRAGIVNVFAGTQVQPGTASLVTITQLDPIAISFNVPQRNLAEALQALHSGAALVTAELPEGRGLLRGKLVFVDNSVDAASGTVKVKAVFDNKDERLWPGAFVGVSMVVQTIKDATVVPLVSVVQGARGHVVFIVDASGKVAQRPVQVLQTAGLDAVVSGVSSGERVVVDGRQNVRPGSLVVEQRPGDAASAAGANTPAASVAER